MVSLTVASCGTASARTTAVWEGSVDVGNEVLAALQILHSNLRVEV